MNVLPENLILPTRTIVRTGSASDLLRESAAFGNRGVLVHGTSLRRSGRLDHILAGTPPGMSLHTWEHKGGEPTVYDLECLREGARQQAVQWVAAVGGGSVLDLGKGCAGLLHASLPVSAYHEGEKIPSTTVPFIAVPTTAGTGSEATPVVVLSNPNRLLKSSIRHPTFMARLVILDPELLSGTPRQVIGQAGLDALTQAIESYLSRMATRFTEQLSLEALQLLFGSLENVYHGASGEPAQRLLEGSYLAGIALANARLGLVHGLAHPLGVRYKVPHGLACAACLVPVLEFNRPFVEEKYGRMSACVGSDLIEAIEQLMNNLALSTPFRGQALRDVDAIVAETLASGSTAANPRPVSQADVQELLSRVF
ncbi:MAG: iron-containing alcohol dehydrogenase family protein [Kiritimatiellia bacterium]